MDLLKISSQLNSNQKDYFASIYEVDRALSHFIKKFDSSVISDSTVIFIYGDHESGLFKNRLAKDKVPLLIYGKNINPIEIQSLTSQLDLAPMALSFIGIEQKYEFGWLGSVPLASGTRKLIFNDGTHIGISPSRSIMQNAIDYSQNIFQ